MVQTDNPMPTPATDPVAQIPPTEAAELTQQQWVLPVENKFEGNRRMRRATEPHGSQIHTGRSDVGRTTD